LFKSMARLDIQPVAYRGTTALLPDLLAGRVTMAFGNVVNVLPLVREGKLRAFAVTSVKRSGIAPRSAHHGRVGYPGFEAVPWFGLMAPSRISPGIVDKVHRDTVKILAMPDLRKKIRRSRSRRHRRLACGVAAVIERETPQWARVIKQAGIKAGE